MVQAVPYTSDEIFVLLATRWGSHLHRGPEQLFCFLERYNPPHLPQCRWRHPLALCSLDHSTFEPRVELFVLRLRYFTIFAAVDVHSLTSARRRLTITLDAVTRIFGNLLKDLSAQWRELSSITLSCGLFSLLSGACSGSFVLNSPVSSGNVFRHTNQGEVCRCVRSWSFFWLGLAA